MVLDSVSSSKRVRSQEEDKVSLAGEETIARESCSPEKKKRRSGERLDFTKREAMSCGVDVDLSTGKESAGRGSWTRRTWRINSPEGRRFGDDLES